MPDLNFQIRGVDAPPHSAVPKLAFELNVRNTTAEERVHSVVLNCQIRFEAPGRSYSDEERDRLRELFGAPEQWGRSLRSLSWTQVDTTISSFEEQTTVELPVECTYDLHVAASKYFYALEGGDVPLLFLFSGTCFYKGAEGRLQVSQIARSKEASFHMPVETWDKMIEHHFPSKTWLSLREDVFDRLYAYKRRHGLPTWEQAVEHMLSEADQKTERTPDREREEQQEVTP